MSAPFSVAEALSRARSLRWQLPTAEASRFAAPWQNATPQRGAFVSAPWRLPAAFGQGASLPYQRADDFSISTAAPWQQPDARAAQIRVPWETAEPFERLLTAYWRKAAALGAMVALPYGPAGTRSTGFSNPYPVTPNPGGPGGQPITVPVRDAYIMIPTLSAVVLPGRAPLQIQSCRISTDVDRYCWNFSAQISPRDLAAVTPVGRESPVDIEITVNGVVFVLTVISFDDNRRFASTTVSISGGSRSLVLDAPFAPLRTGVADEARTAAQLGDEQLFGTGWTLAWEAVDWLLPGDTWSYQDATAIQALGQLASAIGARIETARATLDLTVSPRYPASPWAWGAATPYAIIPVGMLLSKTGTWAGGANSNGVYVTTGAGSGALVRIDGTGGELQAGLIVERLLVTADAQRERGRIELAAAGKIRQHTITLPLFAPPAEPGLIPVGALLQITDPAEPDGSWRAQVMGVTIDATRGDGDSVRQTLTLERHYRD